MLLGLPPNTDKGINMITPTARRPVKSRIVGLAMTVVVAGGVGLAVLGPVAGTAHAYTYGPFQWCPGQDMPNDPPRSDTELVWDMSVCHTYYM